MSRPQSIFWPLVVIAAGFISVAGCRPESPGPAPRGDARARPAVRPLPRTPARATPSIVGSCSMLFHRYKKCKKMPLTEEAFVEMCDKRAHKPHILAEIKCSAISDCAQFVQCIQRATRMGRARRLQKRWREAMVKVKQGRYAQAMTICEVWKDELPRSLKAKCQALVPQVVNALTAEITRKRDMGQVGYKDIRCWDLKRFAGKAGPTWLKKATLLCQEVALARDLKSVRASVSKQLTKASPYLPYKCSEKQLKRYRKLGSPFALKTAKQMIELCYRKLGGYILIRKLPKQRHLCLVKDVYRGIKRYKIRGKVIDRLMRNASRNCR